MANLKEKLGARIQEIRKSKGFTQEKLAELINMDIPNLSNIERGKKFMTSDTLEKIINVLEVSEKELFDFGYMISDDELREKIISEINDLPSQGLKYVYKMIVNLKSVI